MTPRSRRIFRVALMVGAVLTAWGFVARVNDGWAPTFIVPGWWLAKQFNFTAAQFWIVASMGQLVWYLALGGIASLLLWTPESALEPGPRAWRHWAAASLFASAAGYVAFYGAVVARADKGGALIPALCFLAAPVLGVIAFSNPMGSKKFKWVAFIVSLVPWFLCVVYYFVFRGVMM